MGAWGPGVFSDDTANDIRDAYRELLEDQVPDDEASRRVIEAYRDLDDDEQHVLWLSLAAVQSGLGRLDNKVKAQALNIIDSGRGRRRWLETSGNELARRDAELAKLRAQLTGPQPPRKAVRRPWRNVTDLQPGDILSFTASGGQIALLRVARVADHRVGVAPILQHLDWQGRSLPPEDHLARLTVRQQQRIPAGPDTYRVDRYRRKDPDWHGSSFALAGRVPPRPDDDQTQARALTAWTALQRTLERQLTRPHGS